MHIWPLPIHFPKDDLPAQIKSHKAQLCFWTHHKPFKLAIDPAFKIILCSQELVHIPAESLMRDKHLLPSVIHLLYLGFFYFLLPLKRPGCGAGPVVTAQFGVVQEVPHEPDLGDREAVNNHELSVKTGVKCLQMGRSRWSRDSKGPKALMTWWFNTDQLEAHSQKDIINGEQLHLQKVTKTLSSKHS